MRPRPPASSRDGAPNGEAETFPLFRDIKGEFISAAVVDRPSEVVLTPGGVRGPRMEAEAQANGAMLDAVVSMAGWVSPGDEVMEVCVVMGNRVDCLRLIDAAADMYLYVSLDKAKGQYLDTARMRVDMVELAFGV